MHTYNVAGYSYRENFVETLYRSLEYFLKMKIIPQTFLCVYIIYIYKIRTKLIVMNNVKTMKFTGFYISAKYPTTHVPICYLQFIYYGGR